MVLNQSLLETIHRRGGMLPPEPAVTTLGVMHPQIHPSECYRADSICPYSGWKRDSFPFGYEAFHLSSSRYFNSGW